MGMRRKPARNTMSSDPHAIRTDDCNKLFRGKCLELCLGIPGDRFEFVIEKCFPDYHQTKNDAQCHGNADHDKRDHLRKVGCDKSDTPVNGIKYLPLFKHRCSIEKERENETWDHDAERENDHQSRVGC